MRLDRMGCFHQTRLSFMRALLRYLKQYRWQFARVLWQVDRKGVGQAIYTASGQGRTYSLVCFAHDLPPEKRSDRVIAEQWDATFTLYDGEPDGQEMARLADNIPKQEAGCCHQTELVLARANRSVRLFEHVVERLSQGCQPDQALIDRVGYLMRTSAVYGNGKFGLSDRERIADRPEFKAPFWVELLAVWLIRAFTLDIVEHMAQAAGPDKAVRMKPGLKRRLGVGNSTGLGMAPFLILHPALVHRWVWARETALCRVCNVESCTPDRQRFFRDLLTRMRLGIESWHVIDPRQKRRIEALEGDLEKLKQRIQRMPLNGMYPWHELVNWSENSLSVEGQELLVSLVIEPYGELVDELSEGMSADETQTFPVQGSETVREVVTAIEARYQWALQTDYRHTEACARFWYVSEEKLEPRLGERFHETGAEKEQPLAYGRDIKQLYEVLGSAAPGQTMTEFLFSHPQHRHAVRRVQTTSKLPYAEIRDNLIAAAMKPIDLLRFKLSFFGANKFDPRSDRWVRITMYQHAPFPDELSAMDADDWIYPPLAATRDGL